MAKILVVDDDTDIRDLVADTLLSEHHLVERAHDGLSAKHMLTFSKFDLVLLDCGLPDISGIEVLKHLRSTNNKVPVIMLTGLRETSQKAAGLDAGADDYVTKPFAAPELLARVRAVLRRASDSPTNSLKVRNLELDPSRHIITKDSAELNLQPVEFALLEFFMRHPDHVFSLAALIERVWNSERDVTEEAVRTCIKRLRKKIESENEEFIQTVHGVGYRFRSTAQSHN